jgi:hypothetical protein
MPEEERVRIADFSDRELLAVIADLGNPVSARTVAVRIFGIAELEENEQEIRRESRCVISRFVWMRRYGLVDRDEDGHWLISNQGEALRTGTIAASVANGIARAKETSVLTLANIVGERLVQTAEVSGRAMQRELQFQIQRRKRRY